MSRSFKNNYFPRTCTGKWAWLLKVAWVLGLSCSSHAAEFHTVQASLPPASTRSLPIDRLAASRQLNLVLSLPLTNSGSLTNLLAQLYDPASTNYHHFLTPEKFAEQFGPSEKEYQSVIALAQSHGFTITATHPNRTLVDVAGSVADIENCFHIHLRVYRHPTENRTFFAPDAKPSLDQAAPILSVTGLDDFVQPRPMNLATNFFNQPDNAVPDAAGAGPRGNFIGKDFRAAYAPGVALDGTGQAIGLFELDSYYPGDISDYENLAGLPNVPLTNVIVGPVSPSPGVNNLEVALDIDMSISMAPGLAQVLIYQGRTPNDILNRMATDNLARQLSCSWNFGSPVDPAREQIFQQFAAQGQSFFQASGDFGGGAIAAPSDDPYVTVVGGTSLTTATPGGAWQSESAWSGSAGGISTNYSIPLWQHAVNMSANQGSTTMRNLPDVACLADPVIWVIANNGEQGATGGTSAAAPLWAGFAALVNQQGAAMGQLPIGFINPAVYAIGESTAYASAPAFHDITTGNTTNSSSPTQFFAVPGYDLCTGWGTPTGSNLINALLAPADALQITPTVPLVFSGPAGGPFGSATPNFFLTNNSATPLGWTCVNTSVWFNLSLTNGTLAVGGPATTITVATTASAFSLPVGTYSATLWFTNLNNGFAQSRQLTLNVATPQISMTTLYSFTGNADGGNPNGLLPGANGIFYGTTRTGGSNLNGTVFQMGTNGIPASRYSFTGGHDGSTPFGTLSQTADGTLYGTTFQGGDFANGVVFKMSPAGAFTELLSFNGTNGDLPYAGLTFGNDGNFYGTSYQGGAIGRGTAFRITTNGNLTTLYSFADGSDGGQVSGALVQGSDGNFYGTTYKGGVYGNGTIFNVSTNGVLNTLVSLTSTNGTFPFAGLALDSAGNFYGVATSGGAYSNGAIFRLNAAGQLTNLYSFTGGSDGATPRGGLIQGADGNFYGSTSAGGSYNDGTVFVVSPNGALTTLAEFNGINGASPQSPLAQGTDGYLYGTTVNGGSNNSGVIFRLGVTSAPQITSQPASQSVYAGAKVQFNVAVFGTLPLFYQWQKNGVTLSDGGELSGSQTRILSLASATTNDAGVYSVTISNGFGAVASSGATLAVASSAPIIIGQSTNQSAAAGATVKLNVIAAGNLPLAYQWQRSGTNLTDGGNFSGTATSNLTLTAVTAANNGTYSVTVTNALGSATSSNITLTVNAVSAPGTTLFTLHFFSTNLGGGLTPNGLMRAASGELYGTTQSGSGADTNGFGTIFKITTNGLFNTLLSFSGTNGGTPGALPVGALVEDTNGNFFGTTQQGGSNAVGTIFRLNADNSFANFYSFSGPDGNAPGTALIFGTDRKLYGNTPSGGLSNQGTIFSLTLDGHFTNLHSFTGGVDGGDPSGALVQANDGNFYGVTARGGAHNNDGTVYQMNSTGVLTNLYSFAGTDGYLPVGALVQGIDGNLYGATEYNQIRNYPFYGTFFKISTGGALSTLYQLNYTDGAYPYAGLIQGSDGNFYGTTYAGANSGYGTLFRITASGALTTLVSFDGFDDGAHPESALVEGTDAALYGTTTSGGPGGAGTIFRLIFTSAPQITTQPLSQTVKAGTNVSFYVAVYGAPQLAYQWQKNGTNLVDGGGISGSMARILNITNVSAANAGNYSVIISNSLGFTNSSSAALSVIPIPNFRTIANNSGLVTLSWNALAGQKYQLQYNLILPTSTWTNTGSVITATNSIASTTDNIGANKQRWYRILLVQ